MRPRSNLEQVNKFVTYLVTVYDECDRLPALKDLSKELEISVSTLREQMEVARSLGFIEVKPKTGIRHLPYTFKPAVQQSLHYAVELDQANFQAYSDLRNHIEAAYWFQAVSLLQENDHDYLRSLVNQALDKLNGQTIQIPHTEHRELHLSIYRRLENPFVIGLLEAYWEVYEAAGLDVYTDIEYLRQVWGYHQKMVESICAGDYEIGFQSLMAHMDLLYQRSKPLSRQKFE